MNHWRLVLRGKSRLAGLLSPVDAKFAKATLTILVISMPQTISSPSRSPSDINLLRRVHRGGIFNNYFPNFKALLSLSYWLL